MNHALFCSFMIDSFPRLVINGHTFRYSLQNPYFHRSSGHRILYFSKKRAKCLKITRIAEDMSANLLKMTFFPVITELMSAHKHTLYILRHIPLGFTTSAIGPSYAIPPSLDVTSTIVIATT